MEPTARDFETLSQNIRDLSVTIKDLQSSNERVFARKDVVEPRFANLEEQVDTHSSYFTWVSRIVLGAVLVSLLGLVIIQAKP